ncbi:MAG: hypothetical protein F4Z31_09160 [Gemmatimonadetes bacterium]|nr:hypothetical protein [Gemmatimonadota bacterium]MYE95334.1 hypothetical protein [Gemmatimonadota bacterium]MYJ11522.1 hypothetical protein [Gemmatimonadota bacterium]
MARPAKGVTALTVTAGDGDGATTPQAFAVTVRDDRDVLEALYRARDGTNWRHHCNWLSDASLNEWYGVNVDWSRRAMALTLDSNA